MKHFLILGDSLPFARNSSNQKIDEAWPFVLQRAMAPASIWQRCQAAFTTFDLISDFDRFYPYFNDALKPFQAVVIQAGIVDACPRPYPKSFEKWIRRLPGGAGFQKKLNRWYPFLFRFYKRPWVSTEEFSGNIDQLVEKSLRIAKHVVLITVAAPVHSLPEKAPGISDFVEKYNSVLRTKTSALVTVVDLLGNAAAANRYLIADGMHLSTEGHAQLGEEVNSALLRAEGASV